MKAIKKNVILKENPEPNEVTKTGIIVKNESTRVIKANVADVGDEVSSVKTGDWVYFDKYKNKFTEVYKGANKYYIVNEDDILAKLSL